ncbi:MAG: formate/nitrite transporter family protein [Pirellulaceae bacterium]
MNDTPLSHAAELYDLPADTLALLNWQTFITINLIPVTLGNIVGGAGMVGLVYWWIHIRKR